MPALPQGLKARIRGGRYNPIPTGSTYSAELVSICHSMLSLTPSKRWVVQITAHKAPACHCAAGMAVRQQPLHSSCPKRWALTAPRGTASHPRTRRPTPAAIMASAAAARWRHVLPIPPTPPQPRRRWTDCGSGAAPEGRAQPRPSSTPGLMGTIPVPRDYLRQLPKVLPPPSYAPATPARDPQAAPAPASSSGAPPQAAEPARAAPRRAATPQALQAAKAAAPAAAGAGVQREGATPRALPLPALLQAKPRWGAGPGRAQSPRCGVPVGWGKQGAVVRAPLPPAAGFKLPAIMISPQPPATPPPPHYVRPLLARRIVSAR